MTDEFLQKFEERRAEREKAERTVTIAGETLMFKAAVAPEVGFRLQAMRAQAAEQIDEVKRRVAEANGDGTVVASVMALMPRDEEMVQVGDETVLACLEPVSHDAWARLRAPENQHPLTFAEIFDLADYLMGRVAGVPTVAPTGSSGGHTSTKRGSKARSSSPATSATG